MSKLVFGTVFDEQGVAKIQQLLGAPAIKGRVSGLISLSKYEATGSLAGYDWERIFMSLFAHPTSRSPLHTVLDIDVVEARLTALYLKEDLKFIGVLDDGLASDHVALDSINTLFWDRERINNVANDSFAYNKADDGQRYRDIELAKISDPELRDRAMAKGMGKKALGQLVDELDQKIAAIPFIKKTL